MKRADRIGRRRMGALTRLQAQLESGAKPVKGSSETIELSKKDVKRIKREIDTLSAKLNTNSRRAQETKD